MPDAFGRLTPEEERMQLLRMSPVSQTTGMTPGMIDQEAMAAANKSTSGKERKMKAQRALANTMRGGSPSLKGRTVGPYNVHMGPNWGEMVGHAASNLGAAYLDRKAGDAADDIADMESEAALIKATAAQEKEAYETELEAARYQDELDYRDARDAVLDARHADEVQWRRDEAAKREQEKLNRTNANILDDGADDIESALNRTRVRAEKATNASEKRITDHEKAVARENAASLDAGAADIEKRLTEKRKRAEAFGKEARKMLKDSEGAAAKVTATEKTAQFRSEAYSTALQEFEQTIGWDPEAEKIEGYDPTGVTAFWDKQLGGNDLTRWMATEDGQKYKSSASTLKEQILRTATGAAAPQTENTEYLETLIPQPGDADGTAALKLRKLRRFDEILSDLGPGDGSDAAAARNFELAARKLKMETGDSGGGTRRDRNRNQRGGGARANSLVDKWG